MTRLLLTLTPIGLIDSLSLLPFALLVLAVLLARPRPYLNSASFLLGILLAYFPAGLLIVFGAGDLIERVTAVLVHRFWNPTAVDYLLSIVIGIALILLGTRFATAREERAKQQEVSSGMGPGAAFLLGAGATLAGLWGALPYFAAIDQILKADQPATVGVVALLYYNLVFIAMPAGLVLARALLGARAAGLLEAANRLLDVWGGRLLIVSMLALGAVMVADGVGWLFGHPLIPTD